MDRVALIAPTAVGLQRSGIAAAWLTATGATGWLHTVPEAHGPDGNANSITIVAPRLIARWTSAANAAVSGVEQVWCSVVEPGRNWTFRLRLMASAVPPGTKSLPPARWSACSTSARLVTCPEIRYGSSVQPPHTPAPPMPLLVAAPAIPATWAP